MPPFEYFFLWNGLALHSTEIFSTIGYLGNSSKPRLGNPEAVPGVTDNLGIVFALDYYSIRPNSPNGPRLGAQRRVFGRRGLCPTAGGIFDRKCT